MDLPAVIQNALEPPTKPEPNHNNRKRTPEKPDANGQNQQASPQCGEPSINASIHPPWHLKDGETYTEHFVHRIDHSKVPNCDICLNFHICGTCHTKCSRADTHVPFSNLSKQQRAATTEFIKAARPQYAPKHKDLAPTDNQRVLSTPEQTVSIPQLWHLPHHSPLFP